MIHWTRSNRGRFGLDGLLGSLASSLSILGSDASGAAGPLKVVDEISDLVLDAEGVLPPAPLMLRSRILAALLEVVFDTPGKVANAVLDVADHPLVVLLVGPRLDALFLEPLLRVLVTAHIDLLAGQGGSPLLHHSLGPCLEPIRLGDGTARTCSDDGSGAARVSLGVLQAEEL